MRTFCLSTSLKLPRKEVRIDICFERVEEYIPVTRMCFKCQKYGHCKKICRGSRTYGRCGQKDPDHVEKDCSNETKCPKCQRNDPTFSSDIYKREREILEVIRKRNVSFLNLEDGRVLYRREHLRLYCTVAKSAGAVEYTDCTSAEG